MMLCPIFVIPWNLNLLVKNAIKDHPWQLQCPIKDLSYFNFGFDSLGKHFSSVFTKIILFKQRSKLWKLWIMLWFGNKTKKRIEGTHKSFCITLSMVHLIYMILFHIPWNMNDCINWLHSLLYSENNKSNSCLLN